MRKKLLIVIACLFVLICLLLGGLWFYKNQNKTIKVPVASHRIKARTLLSEEDIELIEIPEEYISEDAYINYEDILNKYVRIDAFIPKGSFFYKDFLETKDSVKDLSHTLLKDNEVTYDMFVSNISVNAGSLAKGMNIDLYLTINNHEKVISDLLLKNVRIIGIYDNEGKEINDFDKETKASIISLAVHPEHVSILNKALYLGEIKVVVSNDAYNKEQEIMTNEESELYQLLK